MVLILRLIGWLFIVVGAVLLVIIVISPWIPFDLFKPFESAVLAGVFIALGWHLLTQACGVKESAEKQSHFYLDSCVKAFEEAQKLLLDGKNDRVTWIAAGRALVHAKELSSRITVNEHLRVLELHKLKYRWCFHDALEKQASFFYGVRDTSVPLNKAAKASTASEESEGRVITSTLKELSEKSIYAVWEAAQWPKDYKDPLDRVFSPEERTRLLVLFPGLNEYLEHKERYHSASGRLCPKKNEGAR